MPIQSVVNVPVVNITSGQAFSPPSNDVATAGRPVVAANSPPVAPQQPQQAPKPAPAASAEEVREAADKINKTLRTLLSSSLEFTVDQDSGQTIVRVVDIETKDVIRQIPNEEALAIAKSLGKAQGLLIQQKA